MTGEAAESLDITCLICGTLLASWEASGQRHEPSPDELRSSKVAVPNLGWFCSQACAVEFERTNRLTLRRDATGRITYD
jgi:hypothetical protein